MDRNNRYGSFEHASGRSGGQHHMESDLFRQDHGDYGSHEQGSSRQWGYIATGALMVGLGTYLLIQGSRSGSSDSFPALGGSGQGSGALSSTRESLGRMADKMSKGSRDTPGVQVREQVTVNRNVGELYRFWRNVENLPRVMSYLEDVTQHGDRRSHWIAKGPAGQRVEWDAEITDARENELVAWRALEGSEVPNEGSVRFSRSTDGSGTIIDVALTYHPPGGKAGAAVAKLFGREPAQEIRRDLDRFKERVESGNLILAGGAQGGSFTSG